jgi:hypothetical protein
MFMNLTVSSLSMSMDTSRHTGDASKRSGHSIVMHVHPQANNYLELETGEIFCHPDYFRVHGKKRQAISATLFISKAITESDYQENNTMDRYGGYSSELEKFPSSVYLYYHLPPEEFADVLRDIRSGQIVSSVQINFDAKYKGDNGELTFGWEPDGSGKKWNKDESTGRFRIGIDSVRLFYERSSLSEIAKQTQELTGRLQAIERNVSYYGRIFAFVIAILVFYLVAMRIK